MNETSTRMTHLFNQRPAKLFALLKRVAGTMVVLAKSTRLRASAEKAAVNLAAKVFEVGIFQSFRLNGLAG